MYSEDDELEFIKGLYSYGEEQFKEVYKLQDMNRDKLLQEIAFLMLTYTILKEVLNLNKSERDKEATKFYNLIANFAKGQIDITDKVLNKVVTETVKKTYEFYSYNAKAKDVKAIVDAAYKGTHFSKRVWKNEKEIAEFMNKKVKDFIDGKTSVNKIKKTIEEIYNSNAYEVRRLVETEINRSETAAFKRFCKETGVKKVLRNEVLDKRTCSICAPLDGKVYDLDEAPDVVHPLCRGYNTIILE